MPADVPVRDLEKNPDTRREWAMRLVVVHAAGTLAEKIHGFKPNSEWFEGNDEEYSDKSRIH